MPTPLSTGSSAPGSAIALSSIADANKDDYPHYTRLALERLRPGGMMIADNAIRGGRIVQSGAGADIDGIRAMHDLLAADSGLIATTLPVGDGMAIAVKL
jgi:caffeoyl-CoA O-methyltransferase